MPQATKRAGAKSGGQGGGQAGSKGTDFSGYTAEGLAQMKQADLLALAKQVKQAGHQISEFGDDSTPETLLGAVKGALGLDQGQKDGGEGGDNEVTGEQLQKMIRDGMKSVLEEHNQGTGLEVDQEQLKTVIKEVMEEQKADSTKMTKEQAQEQFTEIAKGVVKRQDEILKREKKAAHDTEGSEGKSQSRIILPGDKGFTEGEYKRFIERPVSWTKGNLPVHGKQLMNRMLERPINEGIDEKELKMAQDLGDRILSNARSKGAKALTSTGSTTGDELVPTDLASELLRRLYLDSSLAQLMMAQEVEMPTNPFEYPITTTRPKFQHESSENTGSHTTDPGTNNVTLNAKKLIAEVEFSYELDEDAIVPVLAMVQSLLAEAGVADLESALINGDTSAAHQDSDTDGETKPAEGAFDGFRKLALGQAATKLDISSGGISRANLAALLKKMGKYGKRPRDMAFILGVKAHTDFLNLDDVVTTDKRGSDATLVTGNLPSLWNIPIVVSESQREDLNASGVYDNTTTTQGNILLANLRRFLLGNRRGFMIETDRDVRKQQQVIVASFRKAFEPIEATSATATNVVIGYNYTA